MINLIYIGIIIYIISVVWSFILTMEQESFVTYYTHEKFPKWIYILPFVPVLNTLKCLNQIFGWWNL